MKSSSKKAKQEAEVLVKLIVHKIDSINSLMIADGNKEMAVLLEGNLPEYLNTISAYIEILYQFADTVSNPKLLKKAKEILAVMYPLMDFVSEYIDNSESPINNIVSLLNTVQAKIKLLTEETVAVNDVALLAQITTMGVIQAIKRNQLQAKKIGNAWFINSKDAVKWLTLR